MMKNISTVIFDWNGTLIDDLWLSVNAMNAMLEKRKLKPITTEYYKSVFSFPVINYYKNLGLDVENEWEQISREFMDIYLAGIEKVKLFRDVTEIISFLKMNSIETGILSAMENTILNKHVEHLKINQHFKFIQGIEDHYAGGKAHLGKKILEKTNLKSDEILFVGDTYHDYEVASEMGCSVVLISRGHNPVDKLKETGVPVLNSLEDLKNFIF